MERLKTKAFWIGALKIAAIFVGGVAAGALYASQSSGSSQIK